MNILTGGYTFGILFKKYTTGDITTKEMTNPNVGDMPALNPAYIGKNKPNKRYKDVTIKQSKTLSEIKQIRNTINSCKETLIFAPKGIENIPTIHMSASMTAFLHILLTALFLLILITQFLHLRYGVLHYYFQ